MQTDPSPESIFKSITHKDTSNPAPLESFDAFLNEGTRLESELKAKTKQSAEGITKGRYFDKHIFKNLPVSLKYGCDVLTDPTEKEVFLVGALGVISGILPNVRGFYDGKDVSPHLFVYVLAKYGTGKGSLQYAKMLGQEIHRAKREQYQKQKESFQADKLEYEKELSIFNKDKTGTAIAPEPPAPPPQQMLFIPANNSKTGLFQLLSENGGRGILFETEGDTLADAIKTDYGNFSDGLRKAFQHETISYYRRTEKEFVEIENPCIATVISSTHDQLKNLIPTVEDGLFSRFLFYELQASKDFKNVFDSRKNDYPTKFQELAEHFLKAYTMLADFPEPITVSLTENQQEKFLATFQEWTDEIREYVSDDLRGSVNRLGLICFRVAMILTVLRHLEDDHHMSVHIVCEDPDFENALKIVTILKRQALKVFYSMPGAKAKNDTPDKTDTLKIKAREMSEQGMSYGEIAKELRTPKTTIHRWINA
jgi:hypothetical protein